MLRGKKAVFIITILPDGNSLLWTLQIIQIIYVAPLALLL